MPVAKIIVSACLLGRPVRYDGAARTLDNEAIRDWQAQGRVVAICPELTSGLGVPRPPAEIADRASGEDVLSAHGQVVTAANADVTSYFLAGARATLALAQAEGCRFALLVDGSPSCGSSFIYDGSFTRTRFEGIGVTTALLRANDIAVFSEHQVSALLKAVQLTDETSALGRLSRRPNG
jgi:uncharacterized protein YbbK (DUF523 family)